MNATQSAGRRLATLATVVTAVVLAAGACAGPGTGSAGTLPPRPTDSTPTEEPTPTEAPATAAPTAPGTPSPSPSGPSPSPAGPTPSPTPSPEGTTVVRVYFLAGEQLVSVHREVPRTVGVARAAMEQLILGPNAAERAATPGIVSTVPARTLLLGITIRDGLATVDLSREFEEGGGSFSIFARLAQLVYTLTQFSSVDRVTLWLDGQPVTMISPEGIMVDHPLTRADYASFLPPVFVETPGWGGTLGNPGRVTGLANTFEATFMIEIRDAAGRVLRRDHAMATCGTGCWGTFDVTLPYDVSEPQPGSIVVYVLSAKDGSIQDVRTQVVTLVPRG